MPSRGFPVTNNSTLLFLKRSSNKYRLALPGILGDHSNFGDSTISTIGIFVKWFVCQQGACLINELNHIEMKFDKIILINDFLI